MSVLGVYKFSKQLTFGENGKEFVDAQVLLERMQAAGENPHDIQEMQRQMATTLTVTETEMQYGMEIPEGTPEEEIKKAEEAGMIVDGKVVFERMKSKIENGELYMYDKSKFLTGEEWVKISTDVEGELNMVMAIWTRQ